MWNDIRIKPRNGWPDKEDCSLCGDTFEMSEMTEYATPWGMPSDWLCEECNGSYEPADFSYDRDSEWDRLTQAQDIKRGRVTL